MPATATELELMGELFEYPTAAYRERLAGSTAALAEINRAAAERLGAFSDAIAGFDLAGMEELYIQTFDLNPDACLDIGWHLFGEDYARGEFLVKLRQEMRRHDIAERDELPDNLLTVLPLAARMADEEAREFRAKFLRPAVEKIRNAVPVESNPYALLLAALAELVSVTGDESERPEGREHD